jgi:hypothetical protein
VPLLRKVDTTTGPVAIEGHTISLVARTTGIKLGGDPPLFFGLWSRPAHVEVLDADGGRRLLPVRDAQLLTMATIAGMTAACVVATRVARRFR